MPYDLEIKQDMKRDQNRAKRHQNAYAGRSTRSQASRQKEDDSLEQPRFSEEHFISELGQLDSPDSVQLNPEVEPYVPNISPLSHGQSAEPFTPEQLALDISTADKFDCGDTETDITETLEPSIVNSKYLDKFKSI